MRVKHGTPPVVRGRKVSEPRQRDPLLRALIEALEARYTQEQVEQLSGVPRSVYGKMRAGSQRISYQDVAAWTGTLHRRLVMARRLRREDQ